jgi:hypothetical protein
VAGVERARRGTPLRAADLVANPVHQGLAQVRLERRVVARLEVRQAPEDVRDGVLREIMVSTAPRAHAGKRPCAQRRNRGR